MGLNFVMLAFLFCFGAGGNRGTDLLDAISTDAYWQAKHEMVTVTQLEADAGPAVSPKDLEGAVKDLESSEFKTRNSARKKIEGIGPAALPLLRTEAQSSDPEVKTAAAELVHELELHGKERDIRRLMAIRTLGERKETGAVKLLQGMTDSKELFVAAYARRALGQIEGKKPEAVDRRAALAKDLAMLPASSSIVAQCAGVAGKPLTLDSLIDAAMAGGGNAALMQMNGQKMPGKTELLQRAVRQVLKVAERVGDVRLDGVTLAVSSDVGPASGGAAVIVRGEYDRAAVIQALKAEMGTGEEAGTWHEEGSAEVEESTVSTVILPSNELAIFVMADKPELRAGPKKALLAALASGKGEIADDASIQALLKTVDTQGPVWAVAKLNDAMRAEKMFEGIDTATLTTKADADNLAFTVTGEGSDAEKVQGSVEQLKTSIAASVTQLQAIALQMKSLQPMLALMQSLKVEATGTHATLTGALKGDVLMSMVGEMLPLIAMSDREEEVGPPQTQP